MKGSDVVVVSPTIPYSLKLFPQIYYFRCVWPGITELPKIASLQFLWNILKNTRVIKLIFYIQTSMKVSYKLIL